MKKIFLTLALASITVYSFAQTKTYAEKLGWPKGAKVLILHVDDAGMSHDSNEGVEKATGEGVATSTSVMMTCPWVPEIVKYIKEHNTDAGLHLTLTSEWENYRWGPLAGKTNVPGLVDKQGCFYPSVGAVYFSAKPDEIDQEIRAQYDRAIAMGFKPTHLDSHMGTLFAKEAYMDKYIKLGIEKHVPVMFPGGEDIFFKSEARAAAIAKLKAEGKYQEGMKVPDSDPLGDKAKMIGEMIWKGGLPVLDDLHNSSYDWVMPDIEHATDEQIQKWYTDHYIESIGRLSPGLTMVIMHCTNPSPQFKYICNESQKRKGDLMAMLDPRLREFLKKNGYILTTWREVMERRDKVGNSN